MVLKSRNRVKNLFVLGIALDLDEKLLINQGVAQKMADHFLSHLEGSRSVY